MEQESLEIIFTPQIKESQLSTRCDDSCHSLSAAIA